MTKKFKTLKRVLSAVVLSASVLSFASLAASAAAAILEDDAPTTILEDDRVSLSQNRTLNPVSYFYGYYEIGDNSHGARGGTHYLSATGLEAKSYTKIYYTTSNSLPNTGAMTGTGWVRSKWSTLPTAYRTAKKVEFCADQYNYYGAILVTYKAILTNI